MSVKHQEKIPYGESSMVDH